MTEVKSIPDLESLKNQINIVRLKTNNNPKAGFFWSSSRVQTEFQKVASNNENVYATLPKEISVSREMGDFLLGVFLEDLKIKDKAMKELDQKYDKGMVARVTKLGIKSILSVIFPNPTALASALGEIRGASADMKNYSKGIEELALKADEMVQEILSSYQLSKKTNGAFTLKRGSWHVTTEKRITDMGRGHAEIDVPIIAMKDIGVDINLVPHDQKDLLDVITKFPPITRGR